MKKIYGILSALLLCLLFMPELRAQVNITGAPSNRLTLFAVSGTAPTVVFTMRTCPDGRITGTVPIEIIHGSCYDWKFSNTNLSNVIVSISVPNTAGYDCPNDPDGLGIDNGSAGSSGDLRSYIRWLVRYQDPLNYDANLAWTNIGGILSSDQIISNLFTPTPGYDVELALGDTYGGTDCGCNDNPLPVELSSFGGSSTNAGIKLNWTTQSETDNAGFVLLRNGQEIASYTNTEALKGHGTTSGATNYTYTDAEAELGMTYTYKIRSVDISGQTHDYTQSVRVKVTEAVPGKTYMYGLEQNYPNPFNPSTTIQYQMQDAGIAKLVVYDALGREVLSRELQAGKGWNEYNFNATNMGSGVYFYRLSVGGKFDKTMKMMLLK